MEMLTSITNTEKILTTVLNNSPQTNSVHNLFTSPYVSNYKTSHVKSTQTSHTTFPIMNTTSTANSTTNSTIIVSSPPFYNGDSNIGKYIYLILVTHTYIHTYIHTYLQYNVVNHFMQHHMYK